MNQPNPRPNGLTAIAIIAIVLGAPGICTGMWGAFALVAHNQMQESMDSLTKQLEAAGGKASLEQRQLERTMKDDLKAVQENNRVFMYPAMLLHVLSAIALTLGGILCLRLVPWGRKALLGACGLGILAGLSALIPQWIQSIQTKEIVAKYARGVAELESGSNGLSSTVDTLVNASVWLGVAMAAGWFLVKLAFYVTTWVYLNQPKVKPLFEN